MDPHSEQRLAEVCPSLADSVRQLAASLQFVWGIEIRVTQGLRSWQMQQELWQQGRDATGKVIGRTVTDAPPGHSWHEFGLAVDVAPFVDGEPDWDLTHQAWPHMVQRAEELALVCGARWNKPDWPHLQKTGTFPVSPNDEARQIFRDAGMAAIWSEAGLVFPPAKKVISA